jgi:hypothetical protein
VELILRETIMAEQPVNLSTVLYLGVFSRAEQRVLQAIFKAIAEGGGRCVVTLATLARDSNTSKPTTRNAIARAVATGLLEKTERRSYCAVSLPNILTYGKALTAPHLKATHEASPLPRRIVLHAGSPEPGAGVEIGLSLGQRTRVPRRRELRSHSS